MRIVAYIALILFCAGSLGSKPTITSSLGEILSALDSNRPLTKNPLEGRELEDMASRSYLYLYRAQGYAHMAATGTAHRMTNLRRALEDIRRAKTSPYPDNARIESVFVDVQKSYIEELRASHRHKAVVEAIEQLPKNIRVDPYYIVIYAHALFNSSNLVDFKRFALNNLRILQDEGVVKKHLAQMPNWRSTLLNISTNQIASTTASTSVAASQTSQEELLREPDKVLSVLKSDFYLERSQAVFKIASTLYLRIYKKDVIDKRERVFVKEFNRRMHNFAPTYIDSLIGSFWKKEDLKAAEMLSNSFLDRFPGHPLTPKVLYNLARLQEDSHNYKSAAKSYEKFLATSDDATYVEAAHFRKAWVLYLDKREKEAQNYFESYVSAHPNGRYASTCEYFLIKIKSKQSGFDLQNALVAFVKKYPLNLYSFLIVDEYRNIDSIVRETLASENKLKAHAKMQEFKADMRTIGLLRIAHELSLLGLKDDARFALKNISYDGNNEWLSLYLASLFEELEDTNGVVSNLIKVAGGTHPARALVPWTSLFPHYKVKTIEQELALQNETFSPLLVLSVIRQESAFDKDARSTANAWGLMQLTEGTAKDAAKSMRMDNFSLLKEEDNIRLGLKTLATLLKKYKRVDYALCAYNAGETPTRLWINLRGHLSPIEFIESIPYPETRIYVKSILRNFAIYQMLYASKSERLVSFDFSG